MRSIIYSQFYKSAWILSAIALGQTMACSGDLGAGEEDVVEAMSGAEDPAPLEQPPSQESGSLDETSEPAGAPQLQGGAGAHQFLGAAPGSMPASGEDVAAGQHHTLFLRPDGTLWAWGARYNGQTGTGVSSTAQTSPIQVQGLPAIKAVAAGGHHSLALDENGFVHAWGQNSSGQLGLGAASSTHQGTPVQIPGLSNIKAIAAGELHSIAMDAAGAIWVWGSNSTFQMGLGGSGGGNFPTPTMLNIQGGAAAIAAGAFHCLVVSKSGAVWTWGANTYGQIGNGTSGESSRQKTPFNVSLGGATAVAVAGARRHSLALLSNGALMAWGNNDYGQLGIGNKTAKPLPQAVPGLTGILQITAAWDFTLARGSSGEVWAWGADWAGTLGDGDATSMGSTIPQAVPNLNATVISAGYTHVVALDTSCSVVTWGQNNYGQLGNSKTSQPTKSPAPVLAWGRPTYADVDQDGYGDPAASGPESCLAPPGYALNDDDCDDTEAGVHPGAAEVCNGVDDNCAGDIDENNPGSGAACVTEQPGVCSAGTTQCSGGSLACNPSVAPSAEACDGLDNDCDGSADEDNPGGGAACATGQPGVCSAGAEACVGGALVCTQTVQPSAEVCDGLDNNCDGSVDEGNPGSGAACATGQPGVCGAGTEACVGGALVCTQTVQPSAEVCDGLDNDCDGTVDEGNPGGGAACATGVPGVCGAGSEVCVGGSLQCKSNVAPSTEACDGLDNNCDGSVDENNPGGGASCATGQPGVCGAGTVQCSAGALVCGQSATRSVETCDGLDNDCDGSVDETTTYYRDNDGDGYGDPAETTAACSAPAGYVPSAGDCDDGIAWVNPGEVDAYCDGMDDDCDGSYDEDFISSDCDTENPMCSQGQTYCTVLGTVSCAPEAPADCL